MFYSNPQRERLIHLNAKKEELDREFNSTDERNLTFAYLEKKLVNDAKAELSHLLDEEHFVTSDIVINKLVKWLLDLGYTKVMTPTIIASSMLDKMSIDSDHSLRSQVFWIDNNKCLRPMLAPNLYVLMRELKKSLNRPVKIFEVGSCFRKESQGAKHMNEFTMLNMVELGTVEDGKQEERLEYIAVEAMKHLEIENFQLVKESSTVYGTTLDIEINGIEVASGSFGPHKLDENWGIFDTWVGIGFGIERLAMIKSQSDYIKPYGRSINFLNGKSINL